MADAQVPQTAQEQQPTTANLSATTFGGGTAPAAETPQMTPWSKDNFDYNKYIEEHPYIKQGDTVDQHEYDRAWADYQKKYASKGQTWGAGGVTPKSSGADSLQNATDIVAGAPKNSGEINVSDAASDIIKNPESIVSGANSLQDQNDSHMTGNEAGTTINPNDPKYQTDPDKLNQTADQVENLRLYSSDKFTDI